MRVVHRVRGISSVTMRVALRRAKASRYLGLHTITENVINEGHSLELVSFLKQ